MFARALTELDRSQDIETSTLDCNSDNTWQHGNSLINYMKLVSCNEHDFTEYDIGYLMILQHYTHNRKYKDWDSLNQWSKQHCV